MVIKRLFGATLLAAVILTAEMASGANAAGKTFPTLTIGVTTYTNVTITDVSGGSIFLQHSRGFESVRIESLSPKVQQQLGVQAPPPDRSPQKKPDATTKASPTLRPAPALESPSPQPSSKQRFDGIAKQNLELGKLGMALALPLLGLVIMLAGNIWLIVAGFRVSAGWGACCLLGTFLCGLLNLIFVCCNWQEAKKPFLCYVGGTALFALSIFSMPNLREPLSSKAAPPAVNAR